MADNKLRKDKEDFDFFDGTFEVTYTGDLPDLPEYGEADNDDYEDVLSCLSELDDEDRYDDDRKRRHSTHKRGHGSNLDGRNTNSRNAKNKNPWRKKKRRLPNLASPIAKTAKSGGKLIYKTCNLLLRGATLILIAIIFCKLAVTFWSNHSALGELPSVINEKNYALAAFLGVALFLLLFELITFFFVLTGGKKSGRKGRSVDRGRGLFSFLFIGGCSYLAWLLNALVPTSPAPVQGIRDALFVYGSMHSSLSLLCIAGIVSCLVRKFLIR